MPSFSVILPNLHQRTKLKSLRGRYELASMFYLMFITVKSIGGNCDAGLKVGDRFEIMGPKLIQGCICVPALNAMYSYVNAMKYREPYILQGKDT
jgi:hypothetical protein